MDKIKNIKFTRKLVIKLILLSPLILLAAYLLLVRPVQVRMEQRDFKAAEAYLEEKKNEIEKLAGPADSVSKENNCSYSSATYSRGTLYCSARYEITYSAKDFNTVNNILTQASKISSDKLNFYGKNVVGFDSKEGRLQELSQSLSEIGGTVCSAFYIYQLGELGFDITLRCSGEAMTEMYPLRET